NSREKAAENPVLPVEIQALRPHITAMNLAAQDGHQGAAAQFRAPGLPPGNSAAADAPESLAVSGCQIAVIRLVLTDFRNYCSARLDLDAGPVVLTGPNGAGKTNLLEAVSFLSPGRGLRRARLGDIDRRDGVTEPVNSGWAVAATLATSRGPVRIRTGREADGGARRATR